MGLCRVYYKADGQVAIVHPAPKERRESEPEGAFLMRVCERLPVELKTLPFDDVDALTLPPRTDRDKWRGTKGQGVKIDLSVKTRAEARAELEAALDAELAKPNPNAVIAMKLQRQLEREDF